MRLTEAVYLPNFPDISDVLAPCRTMRVITCISDSVHSLGFGFMG